MNKIKAGMGTLLLVFVYSIIAMAQEGKVASQVTLLRQGEKTPTCKGLRRRFLPDEPKFIGLCVDIENNFTGMYFGDESKGYMRWFGLKALKEEGLTLTDRGELAKVDAKGNVVYVYGAKPNDSGDLRDALASSTPSNKKNPAQAGDSKASGAMYNGNIADEYEALEGAFQSHMNKTLSVPDDVRDPELL